MLRDRENAKMAVRRKIGYICNIILYTKNDKYDIDNAILLSSNLVKTYNKNLWTINPDTFRILFLIFSISI